jgi:hypothetical protein
MADEMMPSGANGGIVAFADEGLVKKSPEKATSSFSEFIDRFNPFSGDDSDERQGVQNRQGSILRTQDIGIFDKATPAERKQVKANREIAQKQFEAAKTPSTYTQPSTAAEKTALEERIRATMGDTVLPPVAKKGREDFDAFSGPLPKELASGASNKGLGAAIAQVNQNATQQASVPRRTLLDETKDILKEFRGESEADLKGLNDYVESRKGEADKIKEKGLSEALMQFGFNMAAQASKPGSRQGLSGLIGSAASAAPVLGQVAAENEKLQRAASENYTKLKMDQTRYQIALKKGDMTAATSLAAQIRQGDMQQKQLDALVDFRDRQLALEGKKIGQLGAAYAPQSIREAEWLEANKDNPAAIAAYEKATRGKDAAALAAGARDRAALAKGLLDLEKEQKRERMAYPANTPESKKLAIQHQNEKRLLHESLGFQYTGGGGGSQTNPNIKVNRPE